MLDKVFYDVCLYMFCFYNNCVVYFEFKCIRFNFFVVKIKCFVYCFFGIIYRCCYFKYCYKEIINE